MFRGTLFNQQFICFASGCQVSRLTHLLLLTDIEWKIIYVGSAESVSFDQLLDAVAVGPIPTGRHQFVFRVSLQ